MSNFACTELEMKSMIPFSGTEGVRSPPHDILSSESPPSYNQLNYNDNLARFFNSQPKTLTAKEAATAGAGSDEDSNSQSKSNSKSGHGGDGDNSNTPSNSGSNNSRAR